MSYGFLHVRSLLVRSYFIAKYTHSIEVEPVIISVYISGRPFVLRDASEPRKTLHLSDRAENLEGIEIRLKNDILAEAARYDFYLLEVIRELTLHIDMEASCSHTTKSVGLFIPSALNEYALTVRAQPWKMVMVLYCLPGLLWTRIMSKRRESCGNI